MWCSFYGCLQHVQDFAKRHRFSIYKLRSQSSYSRALSCWCGDYQLTNDPRKSTRMVCRSQHRYVPVLATPFSLLSLSDYLAAIIGSVDVLWQMHKMRCFLTHPRQMFWQMPCVSPNKLYVLYQCRWHIQLPFVIDEGERSTAGVVVNCVAVNTNSCNDAKRPACFIWRIRLYGAHSNTTPILSSCGFCATDCWDSVGNALSFAYSVSFTKRCVSTVATCNAHLCSVLLIG